MNRQIYENYVFQVVKYGSLTAAAKALKITQPALSQGLNVLEKEIGLKIFNRRANPITLTAEGQLYYRHLCRMEVLQADFEKELEAQRSTADHRVVIGAPAVYVSAVILPALRQIEDPEFQISIKTASLEGLIELAENGVLDCFISTSEELPEHFCRRQIYQEEIVLCAPRGVEIRSLEELRTQRLISLEDVYPLQQAVNDYLQKNGIPVRKSIVIDQVAEAVEMVEQGIGVCFASREAARGREVQTYPTGIRGRSIWLAYDKDLYQTAACRELMDRILNGRSE